MPTTYAHYRFGCDVLATLPEDIQALVRSHRQLYDFGVHGPDLLFYYRPLTKNRVNQLGYRSHERTGLDFFVQAAKAVKASPRQEAALSYLLGVLCHFTLDRECHPYVAQKEQTGASHSEIEASFDRYLMKKDGLDPLRHKVTAHLKPSELSALEISGFYPPLTQRDIYEAEKSMVFHLNLLIAPPGTKRKVLLGAMKAARQTSMEDMLVPVTQNPKCRDSDRLLYQHYQDALELSGTLFPELLCYLEDGSPLGEGFDHTFGAE
jgi:hypothetical protein